MFYIYSMHKTLHIEVYSWRAPGWLSGLSIRLRLRSWSHSSWVRAPRRALCWQLGPWSLLQILCFPVSLPLPHLGSLPLSLKCLKKKSIVDSYISLRCTTWWFHKSVLPHAPHVYVITMSPYDTHWLSSLICTFYSVTYWFHNWNLVLPLPPTSSLLAIGSL